MKFTWDGSVGRLLMPTVLTMRNMPERTRLSAISGVMFCGAFASCAKGAMAMGT